MAIAVLNPSTSHGTPVVTASAVPTAGNAVIVCFSAGGDVGISSVSDNNSNTGWVQVVLAQDPSGGNSSFSTIWWLPSVTTPGSSFVVTGVPTSPGEGANFATSYIEASGLSGAVDKTATANGASVATLTATASGANAQAAELAVAVVNTGAGDATAFAVGPTWGSGGGTAIYFTTGGGQGVKSSSGYKILSALETTSASWTWTTAGPSAAVLATFNTPASGGGGATSTQPSTTIAAVSGSATANTAPFWGSQYNQFVQLQIANETSGWAFVNFGVVGSIVAATVAASFPVAPNSAVVVSVAPEVNGASVILSTGSGNVTFTRMTHEPTAWASH